MVSHSRSTTCSSVLNTSFSFSTCLFLFAFLAAAKARYDEVAAAISAKEAQSERLANFNKVLKAQDGTISDFDGSLWDGMAEFVTVSRDKEITVTFRDGAEILA